MESRMEKILSLDNRNQAKELIQYLPMKIIHSHIYLCTLIYLETKLFLVKEEITKVKMGVKMNL